MENQDDAMIPTISLGDNDCETTVKRLRSACMNVGFFFLEDHGIEEELINDLLQQSKLVFDLSGKSKKALVDPSLCRGYNAMSKETLGSVNQKYPDTKEGFYVGRHFPADHPGYNLSKLKGPNVMPSPELTPDMADCEKFRNVMETYHDKMCALSLRIVQL